MVNTKSKIKTPDDDVCILALDPNTRWSVTSTACARKDAARYAKYYHSIGYRVKTLDFGEELENYLETESRARHRAIQYQEQAMREGGI